LTREWTNAGLAAARARGRKGGWKEKLTPGQVETTPKLLIMRMHSPPHPGEILSGLWLNPMGLSVTKAAVALGVNRKTLSKIINGNSGISPEMAVRLSMVFGGSPESWMGHQVAYDLRQVEQHRHELNIKLLPIQALH